MPKRKSGAARSESRAEFAELTCYVEPAMKEAIRSAARAEGLSVSKFAKRLLAVGFRAYQARGGKR